MIGEAISQNLILPLMYILVDIGIICLIGLLIITLIDKVQERCQ